MQRKPSQFATVGQCNGLAQRGVVADVVDGGDRTCQLQIGEVDTRLDQVEYQRGCSHLEIRRHLREVRITDDDVQTAVLVHIRVRFVAGVDDSALERGLEAYFDLDVSTFFAIL